MRKIYRLPSIFTLLLITLLILLFESDNIIMVAAEQYSESETIKLGYIKNYGMSTQNNNKFYGYTYDYLMEIAKYTGWNYEFIECDGTELFEKLENGEIDLVAPVQYSEERSKFFDYSKSELYYGFTYLITHEDTELYYEDFDSFNGINVGITHGNFYKKLMNDYCKERNFDVNLMNVDGKDIEKRLHNKVYDAFVITNLIYVPHVKIIATLDTTSFYFASSKKKPEIIKKIDAAMDSIFKENPFLMAELHKKYYEDITEAKPTYTKLEAEFIKKAKTYQVVADPNWTPFEQIDKETGLYSGINIDILKEMSKLSGLKFEFIPTDSYKESIYMIEHNQADLLLGNKELVGALNIPCTNPYLEIPMLLVSLKPIDTSKELTVAMPSLDSRLCSTTIARYPNFKYKNYNSSRNVSIAFKNEKTDLAFMNLYTFNENIKKGSTKSYYTIPLDIYLTLNIGIANDEDTLLKTVLNTTIKRMDDEKISSIIFKNTIKNKHQVLLSTLVRENLSAIIIFVIAFLFIVCTVIVIARKKHIKAVKNAANIDDLTGLSTFTKFHDEVAEILKDAKPNQYMILSMDINNFKYINDTFGYSIGNDVLKAISQQFLEQKTNARFFCRVSSDNFFILMENMSIETIINDFETKTLNDEKLNKLFVNGHYISFCVGIYIIDDPKKDIFVIFDNAHLARKSMKGVQKNTFMVYDKEFEELIKFNKEISVNIEHAVINQELELYLQPKFSISTKKISGAEALVRWNHPKLGFIMPDKFIPILENNGCIQKLDFYMFEKTCEVIKKWNDQNIDIGQISVNFSRYSMKYPNLVDVLKETAQRYGISFDKIEIELTESIAISDLEYLINVMTKIREAGFNIAIDDFGSGYSSLNLLLRLPVDSIKLDREFFSDAYSSNIGKDVIRKIIAMIHSLNLKTIAEGVETEEQIEYLKTYGCDLAQGFFFSRPLTIADFEKNFID